MQIRNYHPDDDPVLMGLERLSPRGLPEPFVHYRRRFIDRAALFTDHQLLVAEMQGSVVGTVAVGVKRTQVGECPVSLGYVFDLRTHPEFRRQGIGFALLKAVDEYLISRHVDGVYAHIVASNVGSLRLFGRVGYQRHRQLILLTYQPFPAFDFPEWMPRYSGDPAMDRDLIRAVLSTRDMYVPDVAERVKDYGFERWTIDLGDSKFAGVSLFDQSFVFQQWPAEKPFPVDGDVRRRDKSLRLFEEVGAHSPQLLSAIFKHLRDNAVADNVSKISLLLDRMDRVPNFLFTEAVAQMDYWMVFKVLNPEWAPDWQDTPIYIDTREL